MPERYIGLMSGTSLDGVDGVLAEFGESQPRVIDHRHQPFTPELRDELFALNTSGSDELRRSALAANSLARCYATVVNALAEKHGSGDCIAAIGCHGQTVRHRPADGYTIQLVNGALLAELTRLDVVCDFRSRDVAAGGQGAPLAPAFHSAVFAESHVHRVIVNVGGIANLTDLPVSGEAAGFDCGPGNMLLDAWTQRHLDQPFDRDGNWSRDGRVIPELLARLRAHEFFHRQPPKSAGREEFNLDWLADALGGGEKPVDVQATLLALTAGGIANAIENHVAGAKQVYLCGGGARNIALAGLLARQLAPRTLETTDALGVSAEHVEALAFAWLARQTINGRPGNVPAVTGARNSRVLGAIYRA
jgi:anhydro-N-acetylmuramic acid kinase